MIQVLQKDGRVVSGVRLVEDQESLTLGDAQGTTYQIRKETIDEIHEQRRSTMPDGLEKILSDAEFLDLISFLVSISD